jgi:hypothetical protein
MLILDHRLGSPKAQSSPSSYINKLLIRSFRGRREAWPAWTVCSGSLILIDASLLLFGVFLQTLLDPLITGLAVMASVIYLSRELRAPR